MPCAYVDAYQGFIVKHYDPWNVEIIKALFKCSSKAVIQGDQLIKWLSHDFFLLIVFTVCCFKITELKMFKVIKIAWNVKTKNTFKEVLQGSPFL